MNTYNKDFHCNKHLAAAGEKYHIRRVLVVLVFPGFSLEDFLLKSILGHSLTVFGVQPNDKKRQQTNKTKQKQNQIIYAHLLA